LSQENLLRKTLQHLYPSHKHTGRGIAADVASMIELNGILFFAETRDDEETILEPGKSDERSENCGRPIRGQGFRV
jgi:hypothetical protein